MQSICQLRVTASGKLEFISVRTPKDWKYSAIPPPMSWHRPSRELFPDVKITIGPAIEDGFYYDFDTSRPFTPEDLEKIEGRMREIVKSKLPFRRMVMPKDEALRFFEQRVKPTR